MKNTQAFTLIELLVVVLIIGILAAVALPQYQQAVNKSRFANLRTISKSFIDAAKAYQLANGEYPQDMEELSIDYPAGMTPSSLTDGQQGSCAKNNEIYCCISKQGSGLCASVVCGRNDYSFAFEHNHGGECFVESTTEMPMCLAKSDNTNAVKLCRSFGGEMLGSWGLITPDGVKSSYNFYRIQL